MRVSQFEQYVEEQVTILTDSERIEGQLFYVGGSRLSDFLNSPIQQDAKFLKVKNPTVYCRRTGEEICRFPFLMVSRDRVIMVMTHTSLDNQAPDLSEVMAGPVSRSSF